MTVATTDATPVLGQFTIGQAKTYLAEHGIPVRLPAAA